MAPRDPTWTEAHAGTFGDGTVAPADLGELDRQQASTYTPTPQPRGLYGRKIYAHPARPAHGFHEAPRPRTLARCEGCGYAITWIPEHTYPSRRKPGVMTTRAAHWSH